MNLKVAVLNGSPKGDWSTTLFSVKYLQKIFKEDTFTVLDVGHKIKALEKDFSSVTDAVREADIVLFSYPVYTFIVPSQLHRVVELLKEQDIDWSCKAAAQITTSKHFYDVTAQKFIEDNMRDLGVRYLRGLYADMEDLLSGKGQRQLVDFWMYVHFRHEQYLWQSAAQSKAEEFGYPASLEGVAGLSAAANSQVRQIISASDASSFEISVVTDCKDDMELESMISKFCEVTPVRTKVINIADFKFNGGCIGCFNCAADGTCIYKDGFSDLLRRQINSSSAVVYAFRIKDHSMGARFKMYDDRQFCNGHRMMTIGSPIGYLIVGDIDAEPNLKMILEARAEVGQNFLCDFATTCPKDRYGNIIVPETDNGIEGGMLGGAVEESIRIMSEQMLFILKNRITQPQNFFGVGGTKIFRDLIWVMRGLMQADHKFYREHGIYDDFPQKRRGTMLKMKLIGWMFNNPKLRRKIGGKINEGMAMPYQKIIDSLDGKKY